MRPCVYASCSCRESGTIRSSPSCDVKGTFIEGDGFDGVQDPRSGADSGAERVGSYGRGLRSFTWFFLLRSQHSFVKGDFIPRDSQR
jgi:hypothetical protein